MTGEPARAPECRVQEHQGGEEETTSDHQSDLELPQGSSKPRPESAEKCRCSSVSNSRSQQRGSLSQ